MIKRGIFFIIIHLALCLCLFLLLQKPIFLLYNWGHGGSLCAPSDWALLYYHGFALDLATAAYLTIIPLLLVAVHWFVPRFRAGRWLKAYDAVIALLLAVITVVDASLYEFWEFKLDATVFMYIGDPKNAFASVSVWYVVLRLLAIILLTVVYYIVLTFPVWWVDKGAKGRLHYLLAAVCVLLSGGVLFSMMRGLRIWPNTPGRAFYSDVAFHNHAALNPVFNLVYTYQRSEDFSRQFRFFPDAECEAIYKPLFPPESGATEQVLTNKRPNILLIVLESFGSVFIESLGGIPDVAPNISRISGESVLFTQCYGSSFRTDRGIVSVLSGYLGQPTASIMRYSRKIQSLPGLPKTLRDNGYDTQVLYASDITFFNMSDYFIAAGHDRLVSQADFPLSEHTCRWGVPDHVAFRWLFDDIQQKQAAHTSPWFTTFLTISSHDPFDVPYQRLEDMKQNAFAYTDSCFGDFIDRLRRTEAWDNLLIICTADHGFNQNEIASPDFPFIPLMLLGGAVEEPRRIDRLMSQTDIAATLLGQMGIPHSDFIFSHNVLSEGYTYPFAFNTYNNGFNFRDSTGCTVFDNVAGKALFGPDSEREAKGKAILQTLYDDLSSR